MYWDSMPQSFNDDRNSPRRTKDLAYDSFMDKENIQSFQSPKLARMESSDLSIFENSPSHMSCDGSPVVTTFRRNTDEHDNNSQDSGYSALGSGKFASPKSRNSFGSQLDGIDENFLDFSELYNEDESTNLPGDFNKLISGRLDAEVQKKTSPPSRPIFRRALSMINTTASSSKARCLFKDNDELDVRNFKRPEPPQELPSPVNTKRSRILSDDLPVQVIPAKPIFQRSVSSSEESIKFAVYKSSTEPDLIGDFSKSFGLPLIPGRHQDLKSIAAATLAKLMHGEYESVIASYKVIDCRYPYEYEGGHIKNAQNIYTKQQIQDELLAIKNKNAQPTESEQQRRHILIFHCEFSSERGPNLSRFLRNIDRTQNKEFYPSLHYPEVYLLDGGYKNFFEKHSELCAPNGYLPMLHPDHDHNLKHFRAKSRTWNSDFKSNSKNSSFRRL